MQLEVELAASVAKDPNRQDLNEDAFAIGQTCFALADGASESYDSQTWARMVAQACLLDPRIDIQWIEERVRAYVESVDFASLSWAQQAAYERGSFATLLCSEIAPTGGDLDVLAIGDSLAILVRDRVIVSSFPFKLAEEFDVRPQLLSTLTPANAFVGAPDFFHQCRTTWQVEAGDQILLVTDAVGHWLLSHKEALGELQKVTSPEEFEKLVVSRRQDHSLRLDDSTVLRLLVSTSVQQ